MLPEARQGWLLPLVRAAWLVGAVTLVALVAVGFVRAFRAPHAIALPALTDLFEAFGLDFRLMIALVLVAPFAVVVLICLVVFARRSDDPMALLFTFTLLVLYAFASRSLLTYAADPVLRHAVAIVFAVALLCLSLVFALFPDGRLAPRWAGWLPPATLALLAAFPNAGADLMTFLDGEADVTGRVRAMVFGCSAVFLVGVAAQVQRYRHASGPTERQQAKWVMAPLGLLTITMAVVLAVPAALPGAPVAWVGWVLLVLIVPLGVLLPVMVANAVLRYRLYDIDRIISRTVAYGLVVVALGAIYAAGVVGFGAALSALTGQAGNDLAVAASVLVAVALFRPLRRRVRVAVDRRFNRTGYEARLVVHAFAHGLRDEVHLEAIRDELADAAAVAVQPSHVSVWLVDTAS